MLLKFGVSYVIMFYLIEDILVFGEDRFSEEVFNDIEVQDLVINGYINFRFWLKEDGMVSIRKIFGSELVDLYRKFVYLRVYGFFFRWFFREKD